MKLELLDSYAAKCFYLKAVFRICFGNKSELPASYIMFSKLAKAYGYIRSGENITQASVHAGFSSSSHFASVNKKLFGISVKELGVVQKLFKTAEK